MKKVLLPLLALLLVLCLLPAASLAANFCPKCGKSVSQTDVYCSHCGTKLSGGGSSSGTTLHVGDIVTFGSYVQDYSGQPIEWIVLRVEGGTVKLLSRYVLECMQMSSKNSTSWKNTKMYSWLQNTFYSTAFTADERSYIVPDSDGTKVNIPSVDDLCDASAGFSTDMNAEDELRVGIGTTHAYNNGLWKGPQTGACNYFTRTEVKGGGGLMWHLHTSGSFGKTGKDRTNEGIRPMIYVDTDYFD